MKNNQKIIIVEHDIKKAVDTGTITNDIVMLRKPYYKDATMIVLPSDHLITEEEKFRDVVIKGYNFIQKNENSFCIQ